MDFLTGLELEHINPGVGTGAKNGWIHPNLGLGLECYDCPGLRRCMHVEAFP